MLNYKMIRKFVIPFVTGRDKKIKTMGTGRDKKIKTMETGREKNKNYGDGTG